MTNFLGNLDNGPKCNMCNRTVIKLVPLYDNDQHHTGQQCCVSCKKKIRRGEEIVKFKKTEVEK